METLESSRVCRLCGQHSGICINIFDKNENHVKKINAVLPILVHEMDLLPKQMCHRCSYKLEEFHKFHSDCLKTDMDLKSQLSWMRKREVEEHISVPMVQIENVKIKSEPPDYDIYELDPIVENVNYISSMSSMTFSMNGLGNNNVVKSHRINDVDRGFTCDNNRFSSCAHCKCNYGKRNPTIKAPLSVNCTNTRSIHNVGRDSSSTSLGSSSRLNAFRNSSGNDKSKVTYKSKQKLSKEISALNIDNILNTDEVKRIKITKLDDTVVRSLRPRKKSVDYLGTKRKRIDLLINPASISRSADAERKNSFKLIANPKVNDIVQKIKKEPLQEIQTRTLRPRKYLVDYLGSQRKGVSRARTNLKSGSENTGVDAKRYKSCTDFEGASSLAPRKCFTNFRSKPVDVRVKEEIISNNEMSNAEWDNEANCNGVVENCVRNLNDLFDRENELAIKLEENIEDMSLNLNREVKATGSKSTVESKSLIETTKNRLNSRNVGVKRIYSTNCSSKYLKSQNLHLKHRQLKKSESIKKITVRDFDKMYSQRVKTRLLGSNSQGKTNENLNMIKIPTSLLKIGSNYNRYCKKCNISFMTRELYILHEQICDYLVK